MNKLISTPETSSQKITALIKENREAIEKEKERKLKVEKVRRDKVVKKGDEKMREVAKGVKGKQVIPRVRLIKIRKDGTPVCVTSSQAQNLLDQKPKREIQKVKSSKFDVIEDSALH